MLQAPLMRMALLSTGWLAVVLAFLGAILPLLPTTPFVLLAAGCFSRGSAGCHRWLQRAPLLGSVLSGYESGLGISLTVKLGALAMLWAGMAFAILGVAEVTALRVLLAATGVAASALILAQPTRAAAPIPQSPATTGGVDKE